MSATAGGAIAGAIIQAIKASGVVIRVDPRSFETIAGRTRDALVVRAKTGVWSTTHHYLTSYKGLAFYTKSRTEISLPTGAEIVVAEKIWAPS